MFMPNGNIRVNGMDIADSRRHKALGALAPMLSKIHVQLLTLHSALCKCRFNSIFDLRLVHFASAKPLDYERLTVFMEKDPHIK